MNDADKQNVTSALIELYRQAWEHYRHIENSRSQYMNFFFTALFAFSGVILAFNNIEKIDFKGKEISYGVLLLYLFNVFTLYIYINIVRIGWVLDGYTKVMNDIKAKLFNNNSDYVNISVRNYLPKESKYKIFSVHFSAMLLLKATMFATNIFSVLGIGFSWSRSGTIINGFFTVALLILVTSQIYTFGRSKISRIPITNEHNFKSKQFKSKQFK
ncbi:MAG: hypothetical protein RBR35_01235 [Salinivirgaceae bacterium]|jgi:hypothetical protein|nr:hypothetical protein [Salinivirgaceae bacterium]